MGKHTPGPWELVWHGNEKYPFPLSIMADNGGSWVARDGTTSSEANARLIAAAPDLLGQLKECCTDLMIAADNARDAAKTDPRWEGVAEKLMERVYKGRAAIAKAEGAGSD